MSWFRWFLDPRNGSGKPIPAFDRHAVQMVWDFAETNPFADGTGGWLLNVRSALRSLDFVAPEASAASVQQRDARTAGTLMASTFIVATDPPYYKNIGYADLSDFFYVWLRRSLRKLQPQLFATLATPKAQELIATPYRHRNQNEADVFFRDGFEEVFGNLREKHASEYPMTVIYALKQEESTDGSNDTGWQLLLEGLINAGWAIVGTWPIRATRAARSVARLTNALASAIVVVCRIQSVERALASRREFVAALRTDLQHSVRALRQSSIAPVDLAQASIGPGMAVFTRYARVIEADGSPMTVRTALKLINQALDEVQAEQESEYDTDTQWAVSWFEQFGMEEALYGEAETLSKAKNTSVGGLKDAGILRSSKGKAQLREREQLDLAWNPAADQRITIWEITQHLIYRLQVGGESSAGDLLRKVGGMGEMARDLAYRLYSVSERKGWTEEAIAYNSLVVAWPEISRLASGDRHEEIGPEQMKLS